MSPRVFDDFARTDATPARHGEGRFGFLNRSASRYFTLVRDVVEDWFACVPSEHQAGLRGGLRADDDPSASAFWELYLHEAYRRSGYEIEIHPEVASRKTRPDFLLARGEERFYLEAVSVGRRAAEIAEDARLDQVHRVLAEMRIVDFSVELSTRAIGYAPLATKKLRSGLVTWLGGLHPDVVTAAALASPSVGFARFPQFVWEDAGWSLVFHAYPRGEWVRGVALPALGMMGPGEATVVDNVSRITRVLDSKRSKYGARDAPLVVAVQSNTKYPTHDYEVENALFGIGSHRPIERAKGNGHLFQEGLWIGHGGWRNADVPQVLSAYGLAPWTVAKTLPRCWSTLEPGADLPDQPPWLAPMTVGDQSLPGASTSISAHFGLHDDWPWAGDPDFDLP